MFEGLLNGICTKPGGNERQKIIVFSPHPDDDVISMGGTLATLADQAHDVHIAYMTSGNIAVFDHDALRHLNYVSEFHKLFKLDSESSNNLCCRTAKRHHQQAVGRLRHGRSPRTSKH